MPALIVGSTNDPAAMNVLRNLIQDYEFKEVVSEPKGERLFKRGEVYLAASGIDSPYNEEADKIVAADVIIFVSRHRSSEGRPALTVHAAGNPGPSAELGGRPKSLALTDPRRIKVALRTLLDLSTRWRLDAEVTMEATHHGPTELSCPSLFIEIGSSEEMWSNWKAGKIAAHAAWEAATNPSQAINAIGLGGGHYPQRYTRINLEEGYAIGHILSKHSFEDFDPAVIRSSLRKTHGGCRVAFIDWKGVKGAHRNKLLEILHSEGVEVVRV